LGVGYDTNTRTVHAVEFWFEEKIDSLALDPPLPVAGTVALGRDGVGAKNGIDALAVGVGDVATAGAGIDIQRCGDVTSGGILNADALAARLVEGP